MASYSNRHVMFSDFVPITPNDSTPFTSICPTENQVGLFIGTGGDIAVEMASGNVRTITVPDETSFYGRVLKVMATGTTASNISLMVE